VPASDFCPFPEENSRELGEGRPTFVRLLLVIIGASVSFVPGKASTQSPLRCSVYSVLKLERHGGRRGSHFGYGQKPRCATNVYQSRTSASGTKVPSGLRSLPNGFRQLVY
jgi:hypothetical protein